MVIEHWLNIAVVILLVLNTLGAIVTVFRDKTRDITTVWAWMLVLLLFPVFGFAFYFFFGRKLSDKRIFDIRTQRVMGIDRIAKKQKQETKRLEDNEYREEQTLVRLFLNNEQAIFTNENDVEIFTDGHEKFARLFADIENATHHINIEYYTIYDDQIGNELVDLLTKKAQEGVRVRVIFDAWGSGGRHNKMYQRLRDAGGQVEAFLMARWQMFSLRVNNHDHRKLVIIDGNIGYIGGFNVGDQYLGRKPKFGHWRDTHLRVEGDAVLAMQSRFFMDWNATTVTEKLQFSEDYFPDTTVAGGVAMQIVSSGPESDALFFFFGFFFLFSISVNYLFLGNIQGTIGETSALAILIGAVILLAFKIIDLKVPLTYIGSFAIFVIFYMLGTGKGFDVNYLFSHIFGGGLMLGAWFMATDYVTTPITPKGQLVYGCCLGIVTAVFRLFGGSAEGVSYAIIFCNLLVPLIEKVTKPVAFGKGGRK